VLLILFTERQSATVCLCW